LFAVSFSGVRQITDLITDFIGPVTLEVQRVDEELDVVLGDDVLPREI